MHPRESIPNVGRRAQGRKTNFTLTGSGVDISGTTSVSPVAEHRSLQQHNGHSQAGRHRDSSVKQQGSMLTQPTHPYSRIIQRILHRRQGNLTPQQYDDTIQSMTPRMTVIRETEEHTTSNPQNLTRHNRVYSEPHSNRRPRDKADRTHRTEREQKLEREPRWQGSKSVRSRQWADDHLDQQARKQRRPAGHLGSTVDLSGGCLTGRCPAVRDDTDGQSDALDTTRSEPSDISRLQTDSQTKLPRLMRVRNTEPLDELLDYYWVYQGMGRQVLNMDIPKEVWERKLFQKPTKLPPIPNSERQRKDSVSVDMESSPQSYGHGKTDNSKRVPVRRRAISEPAYVTKSRHSQRSRVTKQSRENSKLTSTRSDCADLAVSSTASEQTTLTRILSSRHERMKLVIKMPVLTQEKTGADFLDKD